MKKIKSEFKLDRNRERKKYIRATFDDDFNLLYIRTLIDTPKKYLNIYNNPQQVTFVT